MAPRKSWFLVFLALATPTGSWAQGTAADYLYSSQYRDRTRNKVFRDSVSPVWLDSDRFWYRVQIGMDKHEFVYVDATKAVRKPAFDHTALAAQLRKLNIPATSETLPFRNIKFEWLEGEGSGKPSKSAVTFRAGGVQWRWDDEARELTKVESSEDETVNGSEGVDVLSRIEGSSGQGDEVFVTFRNLLKEPVTLFWVDAARNHKPYGRIAAGSQREQHTFAGHAWVLKTGDGKAVAAFRARDNDGVAVVDGKSAPKFGASRSGRSSGDRGRSKRGRDSTPPGGSPDGKWRVVIRDWNVHLEPLDRDGKPVVLTTDGTDEHPYRGPIHWAPDGSCFVTMRRKEVTVREVHMVESSPKDQLQPRLHTNRYAKPGDELATDSVHLFNVEKLKEIAIDDALYKNPWSISDLRWEDDSKSFSFLFNQRGHQVLRLIRVDASRGLSSAVIDEKSETFIDYAGKKFLRRMADDEAIWMSERDGWNHLYLYDTAQGTVKNQITQGPWVVRRVERVDEEKRQIWFQAGGVHSNQDPYYIHLCRVDFDGSNFVVLTKGNGTHSWKFSDDQKYFVDTYSRVDMPPVNELRRSSDGQLVCTLENADWSNLRAEGNWNPPEPFVAKGRDGKTDIYGVIVRPTNFDPAKKYPVIENIYAGPHSAFAPKRFGFHNLKYELAELGFIVVQMDGMGTSHRSKAFHDVAHKNIGDAGFPDRIAWMKAAAEKHPEMDTSRVGIFGGSAGGQNALRALLAHGDFYKVAVSDCGCHDNRMDKVWWNELWMGWPVGPHYAAQSNVTQAHRLEGKLQLTVGELDRNVDPASTMQVVNALIKANKDFDLIVFPGGGHGIGESRYGKRRRRDFFVRHLLGVEPRR